MFEKIKKVVREFTKIVHSLHCITEGKENSRPLLTALQGGRPDKVIHAELLHMGPKERSELKYVLVVKDDVSLYTWSRPCKSADSNATIRALS